jgi:ABC-type sulfate/molybdate transport systems ATPase subunit
LLDCRFKIRLPDFELDVDLEVGDETLVLVGRSGAGKSTTLSAIAGLRELDAGRVSLRGKPLSDAGARTWIPPEGREIGYVFQHYALFPHLDVAENVGFGLFRASKPRRQSRIREALDFVGLAGFDRARPVELSGGERQRVALARALVTDPKALLLDEPLSAFDVASRTKMRFELRALMERLAIPTIVVSHEFEDARVLGDRIAAMHRGRIVQTGTTAELTAHPADGFVAALTGTNLAALPADGPAKRSVAFDPWSGRLSAEPTGAHLQWRGEIVDIRPFGAYWRVAVRCSDDVAIAVDVGRDAGASAGYRVGDVVFAWVPDVDAREAAPRQNERRA